MLKVNRQAQILELIEHKSIAKQEDLTSLLEAKGFSVNQSSVSRDLDELGIIKINGFYAIPRKEKVNAFGLVNLETAGDNMIVAKCEAGLASAVCVRIDRTRMPEIVGTIAGDDTIFIAIKDKNEQKNVIRKIWNIFED